MLPPAPPCVAAPQVVLSLPTGLLENTQSRGGRTKATVPAARGMAADGCFPREREALLSTELGLQEEDTRQSLRLGPAFPQYGLRAKVGPGTAPDLGAASAY